METQNKKFKIDSIEATPNQTSHLSPGIYDNFTLFSTTASLTPDKMTPKKKKRTEISKELKIDLVQPDSYHI